MSRLTDIVKGRRTPRTFEDRYSGICEVCTERIRPGDTVRYDGDDLVHDHCEPPADAPTTETCSRCHMAISVSGECEC